MKIEIEISRSRNYESSTVRLSDELPDNTPFEIFDKRVYDLQKIVNSMALRGLALKSGRK